MFSAFISTHTQDYTKCLFENPIFTREQHRVEDRDRVSASSHVTSTINGRPENGSTAFRIQMSW